jgi:Cu/Ag efflux protein CusF
MTRTCRDSSMLALVLLAAASQAALAGNEAPGKPNPGAPPAPQVASAPAIPIAASMVRITATVAAIDPASLKTEDGAQMSFTAGPEVRNLAQVKPGDRVVLTHSIAGALSLKKGGTGVRERVEAVSGARAPEGSMPASSAVREVTLTAKVMSIDETNLMVRLRGPQRMVDLKVQDPATLKEIKVGDMVEARFRESVAVRVDPAPK